MIKEFVEKIKATKKVAQQKNVHTWYNCVFHSMILILVASFMLSLYTIVLIADITLDSTIGELLISMQIGIILPIFFAITLSYLFLEKLIILHILVFEKMNRIIFKGWQKFDMWYYRRYRKTSPITEYLSKFQQMIAKRQTSKKNRRIVLVCVIAFFVILNIAVRLPAIFDQTETEPITEIQEENYDEIPIQEPDNRIIIHGGG